MKQVIVLFFTIFALLSCSADKRASNAEDKPENPIIGKWKLQAHQDKTAGDKEVDLKNQPTQVILSIADGGYFIIYDTFTDPRFDQKGFSRISERSKGQWEYNNNKLILRHNGEDTTIVEELTITLLNKNTLVTKGQNKKSFIYKTYQGY